MDQEIGKKYGHSICVVMGDFIRGSHVVTVVMMVAKEMS